jgi:hypothetical protein
VTRAEVVLMRSRLSARVKFASARKSLFVKTVEGYLWMKTLAAKKLFNSDISIEKGAQKAPFSFSTSFENNHHSA